LRLVACPSCHTQYDVTEVDAESFSCRCGETLENRDHEAVDARIHRCGSCGAIVDGEVESCSYCGSSIVRDPGRLSLICPECYARCHEEARFCTACGVAFRPEEVHADGQDHPCPVCDALMPSQQVGGIHLNECGTCNGLWVPGEAFDALVKRAIESHRDATPQERFTRKPRARGANPAQQGVAYRKCPKCQAYMQRRNFQKSSGVIVDRCHEHGTWLDADELEQIAGFILSGGAPSPTLTAPVPSAAEQRAKVAFAKAAASRRIEQSWDTGRRGFSVLDLLTRILD